MNKQQSAKEFVCEVCKQVRGSAVRKAVRSDLSDHLEHMAKDMIGQEGHSPEQAEQLAVGRMGSAQDIAKHINLVNRFSWHHRLKYLLLIASGVLGAATVRSMFYPSTSEIISEYVQDGVHHVLVLSTGGIHGPELMLLILTAAMIAVTIVAFGYSSIRTRRMYLG